MEQGQEQQLLNRSQPLPVLSIFDRLDRLLLLLEEKHSVSVGRSSSKTSGIMGEELGKDHFKPLSSALQEVHHKGTLMDRLAMLENRVLKLTLEMDEGNTSRSSSSTVQVSGRHDFVNEPSVSIQDKDERVAPREEMHVHPISREEPLVEEQHTERATNKSNGRKTKKKRQMKWIGRFPIFRC